MTTKQKRVKVRASEEEGPEPLVSIPVPIERLDDKHDGDEDLVEARERTRQRQQQFVSIESIDESIVPTSTDLDNKEATATTVQEHYPKVRINSYSVPQLFQALNAILRHV